MCVCVCVCIARKEKSGQQGAVSAEKRMRKKKHQGKQKKSRTREGSSTDAVTRSFSLSLSLSLSLSRLCILVRAHEGERASGGRLVLPLVHATPLHDCLCLAVFKEKLSTRYTHTYTHTHTHTLLLCVTRQTRLMHGAPTFFFLSCYLAAGREGTSFISKFLLARGRADLYYRNPHLDREVRGAQA